MPGFDRTGPNSRGPMTGRGLGRCPAGGRANRPIRAAQSVMPGFGGNRPGFGARMRAGQGRGGMQGMRQRRRLWW